MAAPSYGTDLSDINLAEATTNWAEPTATGWTLGGAPTQDVDYPYIQGNYSVLQATTKSGIAAMLYNNGSGVTIPTDGAFLVWQNMYSPSPTILDTYANGGLRVMVGSSLADFKSWDVGGSDVGRNPYGGWQNHAVNPTVSADDTLGTPTSTLQYVGAAVSLLAGIGKGYPHNIDAIRYGRCEARFSGGEAANYATFSGFAAVNDNSSYRYGLIQAIPGGYLWKGLITLGYGAVVDFRDSNKIIFVDDTRKVTVAFNKIEIRQASSRVDWTSIAFICTSPSTTASRGRLEVIDDCDVNLDGCTFQDMDTFIFKASSGILNCTFRRCNEITAGGADMDGTLVATPTVAADSYGVGWDVATDPDGYLDNMIFTKGTNAHHALTFGTSSPTTMTLRGIAFSGFNASNGQNDSTLHILRTSGTVTINLIGCSGNISYKTAGATVSLVVNPVTVTVTVQTAGGTKIYQARVLLRADAGGPFPHNVTVTIVNSGTTATVTHTSHGLATNDKVQIKGASLWQNNGVFSITKINDDSYSYTLPEAPGSSPTGTILATFAVLEGLTDINGEITMSRVFSAGQPVEGYARKSTSSPFYKEGPISGAVDSTDGADFTAILSLDE